jgi:hypothetical protein
MMLSGHDAETTDAYETFVATLSEKDRRNVRRHVAACEAEATAYHAALWTRLAGALGTLCDRRPITTGMRAVQFFVADGAYLMQLFALEDLGCGALSVYAPDALAAGVAAGVIHGPVRPVGDSAYYQVGGAPGLTLEVERLHPTRGSDAPDYYRHLLGWNRQAIRMTLHTAAGADEVEACESLCRLGARAATARRARAAVPHA